MECLPAARRWINDAGDIDLHSPKDREVRMDADMLDCQAQPDLLLPEGIPQKL